MTASRWNLIDFLNVFLTLYVHHHLDRLGTMVMAAARVLLITKKRAQKMLFTRSQFLFRRGFCHCYMIQLNKWLKLVINNSYLESTGNFSFPLLLVLLSLPCSLFLELSYLGCLLSYKFSRQIHVRRLTSSYSGVFIVYR